MKNYNQQEIVISGVGVTSAIGQGKSAFSAALLEGQHKFNVMQRPGRQAKLSSTEEPVAPSSTNDEQTTAFLGAEIESLLIPESIPKSLLRTASLSAQVALTSLDEAWNEAKLNEVPPDRIGLIVGGSNFQQRELSQTHQTYHNRTEFLRPTYAMSYMDSDLCGLCTEIFGIRGFAFTLGGASASGQVSVVQAVEAVKSGQVDVCIAIGALMDLSYWECQGFRTLGAMGSDRFANEPALAARPFDQDRDGFIFGESCGVVVIESIDSATKRDINPYARLAGTAMGMDGNRNPNPSFEGEVNAIKKALEQAQLSPGEIDYINPHGTGSTIGDETELKAIRHCELNHAYLNATKSIIGHGLSAAGTVEIIATLMQMKAGKLHPTRNLDNPIEETYNWVKQPGTKHNIKNAINLSMGFGGVNTAVCLQNI
ncbi:beta-ketoacyl synthase N-terminal-like domain-containing protein [Aliikangiella coralliicola]|uniref:Polyketide beta-ketoacyl:ACP synthase n=1 Tax=Aliikangiella coralliicola TaxID=2592383 RepID=A0A545U940_9GAMM|nr:beta-ketoacyl synthase N-terminal-like domain-containing protein [Aliikangiella coralliicola]TQV85992.1 polyketide beta-ketoacyl:ACP synthase [Aliikangiella coralliicola]